MFSVDRVCEGDNGRKKGVGKGVSRGHGAEIMPGLAGQGPVGWGINRHKYEGGLVAGRKRCGLEQRGV